jgi:hypothetical protein
MDAEEMATGEQIVEAFEFVRRVHIETGHLIKTVNNLLSDGYECNQSSRVTRDSSRDFKRAQRWLPTRLVRFWDRKEKVSGDFAGAGIDIDFFPELKLFKLEDQVPVITVWAVRKNQKITPGGSHNKRWWRENCGRDSSLFEIEHNSPFYRSVPQKGVGRDGAGTLLWCDSFWLPLVSLRGYEEVQRWLVQPLKKLCEAADKPTEIEFPEEAPYLTLNDDNK